MTDLNTRETPKISTHDQEMVGEVFDGISISIYPAKKSITGKGEEGRIKGGGSQREKGSRKIRKNNKREKNGEKELIFSLDSLFVPWENRFSFIKVLFLPSLSSIICLIFPLWSFTPFCLEFSCVDQELKHCSS